MRKNSHASALVLAFALAGVGSLLTGACRGEGDVELGAVAALGRGDTPVLRLVRELTAWKARAESAEGLLVKAGIQVPALEKANSSLQARVLTSLESERVVVLSAGSSSGAVLGSLVSVGDGVVAKVVESREAVSAAVVDQSYQGRVGALEGALVRLLVVRP
jgi:hypothetical protein